MTIWELFVVTFWFYVVVACLLIFFTAIFDVFRAPDLGGWAKALWVLFMLVLPVLGVLVYVIARGNRIGGRKLEA